MIARENKIIALTPTADHTGLEGYVVKNSSGSAALTTAVTDVPVGVVTEGATTSGKDSVALQGYGGTVKVKLHSSPGTVNAFSNLEVATNGTAKVASGTSGNIIFAQALESGSASELIEARLYDKPYAQ